MDSPVSQGMAAAALQDDRMRGGARTSENHALCVDLDGTLIRTDLFWECLVRALKRAPWRLLMIPLWLLDGRHRVKLELAREADVDLAVLPYDSNVRGFLARERAIYDQCVLVTGATRVLAEGVAKHVGAFDLVIASDHARNVTGSVKAQELVARFGDRGFDYVGNARVDGRVWRHAARAISVNASAGTQRAAAASAEHVDLGGHRATLRVWLKALRVHQWAKNGLLFVPLVTAHRLLDVAVLADAALAFLAFGLCASATYVVNDLFDLDADRHHATKRLRAFAAGDIGIPMGLAAAGVLLVASFALAFALSMSFASVLALYLVTTLLYSFKFKRIASLDVVTLAGLYTVRVVAGAVAIGVPLSFWLLGFSMFLFLGLALVKRVSELQELAARAQNEARGREYTVADIPILQVLGGTSGYVAVLVLALYINSDDVSLLYSSPQLLWLLVPVMLLWVTRLWVVTTRGQMNEDPIVWAIKDPETWAVAAAASAVLALATFAS